MKYIFAILIGFLPNLAFSQLYVKGENINEREVEYITVKHGFVSGGQNAIVSYDTDDSIRGREDKITDESGKAIKFSNIVSIIAYVSKRGWEYVEYLENEGAILLFRKKGSGG